MVPAGKEKVSVEDVVVQAAAADAGLCHQEAREPRAGLISIARGGFLSPFLHSFTHTAVSHTYGPLTCPCVALISPSPRPGCAGPGPPREVRPSVTGARWGRTTPKGLQEGCGSRGWPGASAPEHLGLRAWGKCLLWSLDARLGETGRLKATLQRSEGSGATG